MAQSKADLVSDARALGIEVADDDGMDEIRKKIKDYEKAEENKNLIEIGFLEENSQALFGQPRSVIVGAVSAGFISGTHVSRDAAEEGIQKFLNYAPGGEG